MTDKENLEAKLKQHFPKMLVNKGVNSQLASITGVPSFIKDWFLMRNCDSNGSIDTDFCMAKFKTAVPDKEKWKRLLDGLMYEAKTAKFLAKIRVKTNITKNEVYFALPDLDVNYNETIIEPSVWMKINNSLLRDEDSWGIVEVSYGEFKKGYKIKLESFTNFRPYTVDLSYYKAVSKQFTTEEWIDVVLGAMGYNPQGFADSQKPEMLKRLLPFVEKRINLIELAPKGTGKSYVFSQISKYGWLVSGGVMSRAKMFYDMSSKTQGLVGFYDYVALDEISTIRFTDLGEMQGALKGYLEFGSYAVGVKQNSAEAGIIFLGNIPNESMSTTINMFKTLPPLFNDSALIDRIHGFVEGWKIPRMDEKYKAKGWSLNTEYFSEILHALRNDISYSRIVDELLVAESGDTRDITAVKRITTAFLKLFFPFVEKKEDLDIELFKTYCFEPAYKMRSIIKEQLMIMDKEYKDKPMPCISIAQTE